MLQRLFHLEKYGDQLAIKLSRRVKDNDMVHQALLAEQQGLGNASQETLEETKRLLQEAVKHAELSVRHWMRLRRKRNSWVKYVN